MAELKKYVLLDHLNPTAPIYNVLGNGQKLKINKIPYFRPYLQITFTDREGNNRTIRYKNNANSIYQDEQIKAGILANERFSNVEREDLYFKNGLLATIKPMAQKYLDATPENEAFEGICDEIRRPAFRLLDEKTEAKLTNEDLRQRAKAATKIFNLDLEEAQSMIIRLNGSHVIPPNDVVECQNLLIDFLDDSEEAGVAAILKEDKDVNVDEKTNILISKLVNAKLLSFDAVSGTISKKDKTGSKWVKIREMADTYEYEEKKRLFSDFLNTDAGKDLKADLEKDLADFKAKKEKK